MLEELDPVEGKPELPVELKNCIITLNNVTAKWDKTLDQYTLKDISVEVKPGKLLAVIGPVGAGKTSLLMSILRELPLLDGNINVKGRIAYVSQQAWVFSASLRQNITFGSKYDKKKYDRIIRVCALTRDLEIMPHGDSTLIGDRGVSLSGGQRARVSLARALYTEADIYLLDDPLSAVDAAVGRHLFEKVVQGYLKSKPRILVTHQLQYLEEADEILILKEGQCLGKGTFEKMANSGIDFSSLLKTDKDEEEKIREEEKRILQRLESVPHSPGPSDVGSMLSLTSIGTEFEAEPVQQPEEEERKEGTVGARVYYEYFKAGAGPFKFLILVLLNLVAQTSYIMSDWWLSYWSNQEEAHYASVKADQDLRDLGYNVTNITIPIVDTHQNIYIFTGIIAAVFLFGILRALMFFKVAVDASMALHNKMFNRILRVPIMFFDTNPVGRILNRFSKDTGHMDDLLPITFFDFVQCFLLIIGIILVVCVVNPWVFIPLIPLCILFFVTRTYYIQTSRHVKRLEGTTRSPVFSHLSASLLGLHSIRAFSMQNKFIEEYDNHQNLHSEAWFMFLATSRWLAVRLDWICAMFVTVVAFACVLVAGSLDAGEVGLSLTYAMTLMGMFQWAVRQSAEVENQMISVERVLDYSKLNTEAELTSDKEHRPSPDWPKEGGIKGDGAGLRYSKDAPLVLKHLEFHIKGKEKIGIVGRTGAGKSSLITMLFRLVEPEGSIYIDNVNICKIGLHELRNKISIIPQDPVLFTGTLRKNLDPFAEQDDAHLWSSLEEVQMKSAVEELPQGLDSEVSEAGINFSVGQRQLICLARAILRRNKILMIDEATANVDPRTDELIQQTIREKFLHCTVLTIAHRLNTIMDSDRILVLDSGNIVEFDQPYNLLRKQDGPLYKMVQQTGKAEAENLLEIAKRIYKDDASTQDSGQFGNKVVANNTHEDTILMRSDHDVIPNKTDLPGDDKKKDKEENPSAAVVDVASADSHLDEGVADLSKGDNSDINLADDAKTPSPILSLSKMEEFRKESASNVSSSSSSSSDSSSEGENDLDNLDNSKSPLLAKSKGENRTKSDGNTKSKLKSSKAASNEKLNKEGENDGEAKESLLQNVSNGSHDTLNKSSSSSPEINGDDQVLVLTNKAESSVEEVDV